MDIDNKPGLDRVVNNVDINNVDIIKDNNNNCVIGLCVYNNEPGLPSVLSNIVKISESGLFDKLTVVAFYDHSGDKSHSIMTNFKTKCAEKRRINETTGNIEVIIIVNKPGGAHHRLRMVLDGNNALNRMDKGRTARISIARNGILNVIRGLNKKGVHHKYFIMMDSNEYACVGQINIATLRGALARSDEWDSVSFNREAGYYDYWALSYDPYIYSIYHVVNRDKMLDTIVVDFNRKLKEALKPLPPSNPNDSSSSPRYDLISVYSSYNGFAIYKTDKFLNCSYSSNIDITLFPRKLLTFKILNSFTNDCEHRKFHLEAIKRNNARIMVSPLSIFYKLPVRNPALRGPA